MSYFRELIDSRELLANLVLRETKGQYKQTIFGRLWALANPLFQMVIYTFVFGFIFRATPSPGDPSGLNIFSVWLLCGLLPWTFFAAVVNQGMGVLVMNSGLIQKVYFSRAVLPLAVVGSVGYNWLYEMLVLVVALALFGSFIYPWIPLILLAMVLLAAFATGFALVLSILNVHFRDLQYFMTIMLTLWMYMTPIVYPISLVAYQSERIGPIFGWGPTILEIYRWNPMERFVEVFRDLLYNNRFPNLGDSAFVMIAAAVSLLIGLWVFRKNERGLAEAL